MSKSKKKDSSWKNFADYHKGISDGTRQTRLENGVLQHPDEDPKTSIYNFMVGEKTKRKELHIMPFKQYEEMGK